MAKNVIITKTARKKLVQARAGAITLPKIVGMVFGSGGVDSSGNVIAPSENQTKLNKELFRKPIDGYSFTNDTTCRYECTLSESELAGEYISEIVYTILPEILSALKHSQKRVRTATLR